VSLSAALGFRLSVPLLILSGAAVIWHLDLPTEFDWLETNYALIAFVVASILEVGAYYIPWFDNFLDTISLPLAVVAGTLVTAAAVPEMNPLVQWTLAILAGGGTAGLTKGIMSLLRAGSSGTTGGIANPVLSTLEGLAAIALTILAITLPLFTGVLVMVLLFVAIQRIRRFFWKRSPVDSPDAVA
jgi:uncharacterized membrane protein